MKRLSSLPAPMRAAMANVPMRRRSSAACRSYGPRRPSHHATRGLSSRTHRRFLVGSGRPHVLHTFDTRWPHGHSNRSEGPRSRRFAPLSGGSDAEPTPSAPQRALRRRRTDGDRGCAAGAVGRLPLPAAASMKAATVFERARTALNPRPARSGPERAPSRRPAGAFGSRRGAPSGCRPPASRRRRACGAVA